MASKLQDGFYQTKADFKDFEGKSDSKSNEIDIPKVRKNLVSNLDCLLKLVEFCITSSHFQTAVLNPFQVPQTQSQEQIDPNNNSNRPPANDPEVGVAAFGNRPDVIMGDACRSSRPNRRCKGRRSAVVIQSSSEEREHDEQVDDDFDSPMPRVMSQAHGRDEGSPRACLKARRRKMKRRAMSFVERYVKFWWYLLHLFTVAP